VKRRGVSEVTGSVLMLGIVGVIAAIILTFGLASILDFQTFLIDVEETENTLKERIVINNVAFNAGNGELIIYVRNVGLNIVTIESFMITNIDTQVNILFKNDPTSDLLVLQAKTVGNKVFPNESADNTGDNYCTAFSLVSGANCLSTSNYDIRIVTDRGNIFVAAVKPFRV